MISNGYAPQRTAPHLLPANQGARHGMAATNSSTGVARPAHGKPELPSGSASRISVCPKFEAMTRSSPSCWSGATQGAPGSVLPARPVACFSPLWNQPTGPRNNSAELSQTGSGE